MIRLKNLLIEQRVKAIIKRAPEQIVKKAAEIYSMAFRVKEISIDKIGSKGQKQWQPLSNEDLISFLKDDPDIGASSKYADESYYIVGTDLKSKSQKREVYDILILKKFRVINVVNGERIYSDINDYLTSKPSAIGSIGTSEIVTFKDFYDSINPTANIGEKTEKGVEITGKYLQQTIGAILDPDNTAAVGSAERIAIKKAKEEKQKAEDDARQKAEEENRVIQQWKDVFNSAIADKRLFWAVYNTHNDTGTVYYFMQLSKVQTENPNMYEYTYYTRHRNYVDDTNPTGKGDNDGELKTIDFTKLKEKFSGNDDDSSKEFKIDRYVSNEEFSKITAINDATIFDYLKTKLIGGVTNVETNNKILIDYTFKTHGKQQLTKTKILELFGISDVSANTMSLKSVMTAGSLQSMIIQLLLKRDVVPTLKNDTGWMSHIETTCLVGGKNVLAIYDAIPSPVDGDYGTKSQNMMRVYAYVYNNLDHGSTAWAKILKDVNAAWPTMKFLNDTVLFKDFSPIIESRHISLKSLLQEKNNLTYDFLFEIAPPPAMTPSTTPPAPEKKTTVKLEPKTTTATKTEPEPSSDTTTNPDDIPGSANILISGLHGATSPGYKSVDQQNILAGTDNVFEWESAANLNQKNFLSQTLKRNTTGQVICFSKGCEYASEIAKHMSDKSNLWIVEPYGKITIPAGVWKSHVILGPTTDRGSENFVDGMINTPEGTDHWGALKLAGQQAAKWNSVVNTGDSSTNTVPATDTSRPKRRGIETVAEQLQARLRWDASRKVWYIDREINVSIDNWPDSRNCFLHLRDDGTILLKMTDIPTYFAGGGLITAKEDMVVIKSVGSGWDDSGKKMSVTVVKFEDGSPDWLDAVKKAFTGREGFDKNNTKNINVTGTNFLDCLRNALHQGAGILGLVDGFNFPLGIDDYGNWKFTVED